MFVYYHDASCDFTYDDASYHDATYDDASYDDASYDDATYDFTYDNNDRLCSNSNAENARSQ